MKTISTLVEAMKTSGTPLVGLLGATETIVSRDQPSASSGRPGAAREAHKPMPVAIQEAPAALSDAIGCPAELENLGDQETHGVSAIRGEDKVVFIPALTKRKSAAESPRFDLAHTYLAIEHRQADALENFVFILLWLSSLFALAYFLSV